MHALLHLIAARPGLLAEHAEAYAALAAAELPRISAAWQRSALLYVLAVFCLIAGAVLAGVATMLWAVAAPAAVLNAPWALLAVPLLPLLAGVACAVAARAGSQRQAVDNLRQQLQADIAMLREASAS